MPKRAYLLFAGLVASLGSLLTTTAIDCQPDRSSSPCKADCGNAGWLDISAVFEYPVTATSSEYDYQFSPCTGVPCVGESLDTIVQAGVCQVTLKNEYNYTCAGIGQDTWTLEQTNPYVFTVKFSGGSDGRTSTITFREDTAIDTTKIKYIDESPRHNYNFKVNGKYVGQPAPVEQCVVDTNNPCVARCADKTFDISNIFQYPITTQAGSSSYWFSPCGRVYCGDIESTAVCQSVFLYNYSCGRVSSMKWWLNQTKPFYQFTIEYSDGTSGRKSVFSFVEDVKMFKTALVLLSEQPELQYNFEVRGRNIGQPGGPTEQCMVDPDKPWVLKCNGSVAVDISDVFEYPITIKDPKIPTRNFTYNPVTGSSCTCNSNPTPGKAVCQADSVSDLDISCGLVANVTWKLNRTHPFVFQITYEGGDNVSCDGSKGDGLRSSEVLFYEDPGDVLQTTFSHTGENPKLNYNFLVKGSYVGQKLGRGDCKLDPKNPCMAVCNDTVTIDISKLFPYPMTIIGEGGDNFIFSPCSGYSCGNKNSSVCLNSGDNKYSCGVLNTAKWTLRQSKQFYIFIITYTGGDIVGSSARHSTFTFIENSNVANTVPIFNGVQFGDSYLFDIVGSCVGQPGCNKMKQLRSVVSASTDDKGGAPVLPSVFIGLTVLVVVAVLIAAAAAAVGLISKKKKDEENDVSMLIT